MISVGIYHRQILCHSLSEEDHFQVDEVHNLLDENAIRSFDILIADVSHLNDVDYMRAVNILLGDSKPKVILLKENFTFEEMKKLMRSGVYDCLEDPISMDELRLSILNALVDLKREIRKEQKETSYTLRSVRECLAYDLLHGNTKNAKEIWERSQLAELSLIPNTVLLLSIDHFSRLVENKGEMWKNDLREEVLRAIEECHLQYESLKVLVTQDKYAILLALPVQLEEKKYKKLSMEYAEKIQTEINRKTNYTVTIGIGNYYEDARNLHLSFQESEQAQSYRLFSSENSVIHIEDLDFFETSGYYEYKVHTQAIVEKFSLGDIEGVLSKWEEVYYSVVTHARFEPEEFRLQVLDLLFSLSKSAVQNGASPKNMMPLQIKYAKELHDLETISEIDKWVRNIIHEYNNQVNEGHNEQSLKSVQEILQYIEEHFHEEIGLETVATQVNLSPNYVSAIFKQTTGSSFSYYVTDRRMKKAKHLLEDFNMTIYEIAESIGYSSSQYFSRVFKNHTGMTPTTYRNSLLSTKKW